MVDGTLGGPPDLLWFERQVRRRGYAIIAGIDEAGRGPLAGPVVAAAVVLPRGGVSLPVNDSKCLSARQRTEIAIALRGLPDVSIGIGVVPAPRIDQINILNATQEAMTMALSNTPAQIDFALVDGLPMPGFPIAAEFIVKGDSRSASVAAASIIAKVHRDQLMDDLDILYPSYGFARHKGYGTPEHLAAVRRLGPTPVHRRSFAPIARLQDEHIQLELPLG